MIKRDVTDELLACAGEYPVVTILGPRQSGKTTLAQMTFPDKAYVSLEDPDVRMAAEADPRGFLNSMPDGAILDEIQRLPVLLSFLQGIVDEKNEKGRYILTGSNQLDVHEKVSQTLAGRTALLHLLPFSLPELDNYGKSWDVFDLMVRGFFPRVHEEGLTPDRYYKNYVATYVERDVRSLIQVKDLESFQRFLVLIAGRTGQVVNFQSLGNDTGVSGMTIKSWISVLKASFVIFELQPYFENIGKRVIKSPKLYFSDTGLACRLLGIDTSNQLRRDPLRGQIYENFVILEFLKSYYNRGKRPELFFYRDTHGNEVDLLIRHQRRLYPVEIKSSETFTMDFLKGIKRFKETVKQDCPASYVLYNGDKSMTIHETAIQNILLHGLPDL